MNTRVRGKWRRSGRSSRSIIRSQGEHHCIVSLLERMIMGCWKGKERITICPSSRFAIIKSQAIKEKNLKSITSAHLGTSLTSTIGARQSPGTSMITVSRLVNHINLDLDMISQRHRSDLDQLLFYASSSFIHPCESLGLASLFSLIFEAFNFQ